MRSETTYRTLSALSRMEYSVVVFAINFLFILEHPDGAVRIRSGTSRPITNGFQGNLEN